MLLYFFSLLLRKRRYDSEKIFSLPATGQPPEFAAGQCQEREVDWKTAKKTISMFKLNTSNSEYYLSIPDLLVVVCAFSKAVASLIW